MTVEQKFEVDKKLQKFNQLGKHNNECVNLYQ